MGQHRLNTRDHVAKLGGIRCRFANSHCSQTNSQISRGMLASFAEAGCRVQGGTSVVFHLRGFHQYEEGLGVARIAAQHLLTKDARAIQIGVNEQRCCRRVRQYADRQ